MSGTFTWPAATAPLAAAPGPAGIQKNRVILPREGLRGPFANLGKGVQQF